MSNLEKGFTALENDFFDALIRFPFSKRQFKVMLSILRKTRGYNKREDDISASQISLLTGIARSHASLTVNELTGLNVLLKKPGQYGQLIAVNLDYSSWYWPDESADKSNQGVTESVATPATKTVAALLPKQYRGCYQNSTPAVTETVHTINNHQKTTTNKQPPLQKNSSRETAEKSRSGGESLIFPKAMNQSEQHEAVQQLKDIPAKHAQAIIDVLAVMITAGEVRKSNLAVLAALIRRFTQGSFDPAPGMHLQQQRRQRVSRQQALAQHEQQQQASLKAQCSQPQAKGFDDVRAAMRRPAKPSN